MSKLPVSVRLFAITSAMLICLEVISPEYDLSLVGSMWLVSFVLSVVDWNRGVGDDKRK